MKEKAPPYRPSRLESAEDYLRRYPRLCAHVIAESLGYATPMVAATILKASKTPHPGTSYNGREVEALRGRSLLPLLSGEASAVYDDDTALSWELFGMRAVRKGDFKLLRLIEPYGHDKWQLYNLTKDPGETVDLSKEMPELRSEMIEIWKRYSEETGVILPSLNVFTKEPRATSN